jgi:hypothetical protein
MSIRFVVVESLQVQQRSCMLWLDGRSWRLRNRRNLNRLFVGRLTPGAEMRSDLRRKVVLKSTGMGLLTLEANFSQIIQDCIALNFQFTRQFVDPYLSHA